MDIQQIAALVLFLFVYTVSASRLIHRAAAALVGALVAALLWGLPTVLGSMIPEVLLVTAGLMVLTGYVRKSGIASWLALKAAKAGRGRPNRILILLGVLTWVAGSLLGPVAAVALVVPVALLLAVELDISPLPFVIVLSWTSLLGGATTLTAQPGNLWIGDVLGLDSVTWVLRMFPFTFTALLATLAAGYVVFRKGLRVTHERRARVLEYDEARSLGDRHLLRKTLTVLFLVVTGLVAGPWIALAPSVVAVGGAVLLWLWNTPRSTDRFLGEGEGSTLLFFGGLMVVVGALVSSGLPLIWASVLPAAPLVVLGASALLGAFLDHGAAAGALTPLLETWAQAGIPGLWPYLILGTSLGAGITVLGSASNAAALGLAGQGPRKLGWRDFTRYGLLFAAVNLTVVSGLSLVWGN